MSNPPITQAACVRSGPAAFFRILLVFAANLAFDGAHAASVSLTWTDNSSNETGFRLERAGANHVFALLGTVGANITSYTDASVSPGGSYYYRTAAFNGSASSAFSNETFITVAATNTPPTISDLANLSVNEDMSTPVLGFTVGDAQTAAGSLVVTGGSSNLALVPNTGIVFGGSGANRTVRVTPAANQNGSATITVSVSDGTLSASDTFLLTVSAVNDAPTITPIANQSTPANTATSAIGYTVGDVETAAGSLIVAASSSDTALVPDSGIVLGGTGTARTITLTPAAGLSGTATISVTVSDGNLSSSRSFLLTVNAPAPMTATQSNAASLTIPALGKASPYGAPITLGGLAGPIVDVSVRLNRFSHSRSEDVDILLVGPDGTTVVLMSDAGSGKMTNVNLTFSQSAPTSLSSSRSIASGTYRPTDFATGADAFPAPAPAGPYGATLSGFVGKNANGTWSLYVVDDRSNNSGSIAGGWTLVVTTSGATPPAGAAPLQTVAPGNLAILSSQANVSTGEDLSVGFTIGGTEPRSMLLRGIGPGLASLGVANPVATPNLKLRTAAGVPLLDVGAWGGSAVLVDAFTRLGAFPLQAGSADAAVLTALATGTYRADISSGSGVGGAVLAEVYDAGTSNGSRVTALTVRRRQAAGGGAMTSAIAVVGGTSKRLLIRGLGPVASGAPDALPDPVIRVFNRDGQAVTTNDNWEAPTATDAATPAEIIKALTDLGLPLYASGSTDATVLLSLPAGVYTIDVADSRGAAGIAIAEVYELP